MSPPRELGYAAFTDLSESKLFSDSRENLRETELRLGLPGSESSEKSGVALGLHLSMGFSSGAKRGLSDAIDCNGRWVLSGSSESEAELEKGDGGGQFSRAGKAAASLEKKSRGPPASKTQVVGWPPIRSYRKNTMATNPSKDKEETDGKQSVGCLYIKVSMDGAPYLRKVYLRTYFSYKELSSALEKMFSGFTIGQCGSNGVPDKDELSESCLKDLLTSSEYVLTYEDRDGDWMLVGDVPWEMFIDSCRRLRIMKGSDAIGLAPRVISKSKHRS